jgi:hypothetical protein
VRFPDIKVIGTVTVEDAGTFDLVMVRAGALDDPPDAPKEMDEVQGRDAWEAGWYACAARFDE